MPRKSYELIYQDGSKQHIDREERDDLVLSGQVKQVGPCRYKFTGQVRTYHSFRDYGKDYTPQHRSPRKKYYPGQFIVEFGEKRQNERLETPEAYVQRLGLYETA